MSFNVGDIVKRGRGEYHYKVIKDKCNSRYGEYLIINLTNGNKYNEKLDQSIWIKLEKIFITKNKLKRLKFLHGLQ